MHVLTEHTHVSNQETTARNQEHSEQDHRAQTLKIIADILKLTNKEDKEVTLICGGFALSQRMVMLSQIARFFNLFKACIRQ